MNELKLPKKIRRIVTGIDSEGRSCVIEDSASPHVRTIESRPGFQAVNLWATTRAPAAVTAGDGLDAVSGVAPPLAGTVFRIIDIPPESSDPEETRRRIQATFGNVFPDAHRAEQKAEHPGMHKTDSIDYALILEGEVYAVFENGEAIMRPGDVLIQRGTRHSWANRSDSICRLAFVLVSAQG